MVGHPHGSGGSMGDWLPAVLVWYTVGPAGGHGGRVVGPEWSGFARCGTGD